MTMIFLDFFTDFYVAGGKEIFGLLSSEFFILPKGWNFIWTYDDFEKGHTNE